MKAPAKKTRRGTGRSFRLAPHAEMKTPREGTKQARVLEMIGKPEGELFSVIQKACGWNLKNGYENVRRLNWFGGFGLWHENAGPGDYRIWLVDDATFCANVHRFNS